MKYERLTNKNEKWEYSFVEDEDVYIRLQELEDKIENGTLIELPCKVGATVFMPWVYDETSGIAFNTIRSFIVGEKGLIVEVDDWESSICYPVYYEISYLGDLLYLTRAEAEAKLRELEFKQRVECGNSAIVED